MPLYCHATQINEQEHVVTSHHPFYEQPLRTTISSLGNHPLAGHVDDVYDHPICHLKTTELQHKSLKMP